MTFEEFAEIRAIEQLKYRYMRAYDTKDWTLMAQCFAEDASCWYGNGKHTHSGHAAVMAFLRRRPDLGYASSHIALHPEIELTSPTTAKGVWRLEDIVHFTEAYPGAKGVEFDNGTKLEGAGYYYDDYVKTGGIWLIKTSGYVRLFETLTRPDYGDGEYLKSDPSFGRRSQW